MARGPVVRLDLGDGRPRFRDSLQPAGRHVALQPPLRTDAPGRVAAVGRTALLDTPPEESFDRLTRMAARLLGAPVALISLLTDDREFFKSATGLPEPWATRRSAPLTFSLGRHSQCHMRYHKQKMITGLII